MNRAATAAALGAIAAQSLSEARSIEESLEPLDDPINPLDAETLMWAADYRLSAGACIAAINHLNGVSPE